MKCACKIVNQKTLSITHVSFTLCRSTVAKFYTPLNYYILISVTEWRASWFDFMTVQANSYTLHEVPILSMSAGKCECRHGNIRRSQKIFVITSSAICLYVPYPDIVILHVSDIIKLFVEVIIQLLWVSSCSHVTYRSPASYLIILAFIARDDEWPDYSII